MQKSYAIIARIPSKILHWGVYEVNKNLVGDTSYRLIKNYKRLKNASNKIKKLQRVVNIELLRRVYGRTIATRKNKNKID